ncbi:MAG: GNAT family N-acetyltransferase [Eubacteriales bacterium]|nr:GNAT family N-acetyltransferase [Eubacteriales bacterium]
MEFRAADLQDLSQLKALYRELVVDLNRRGIHTWDEYYPSEFVEGDIREHNLYLLCDGSAIASVFALCPFNPGENAVTWKYSSGKALYLERFGVNLKYFRQGIGSYMLSKAKETAKQKGADHLRLFVVTSNEPAIRFYLKNGFTKAEGEYVQVVESDYIFHEWGYESVLSPNSSIQ